MRIELDNLEKSGEFAQTYRPGELALDDSDLRLIGPAEIRGRYRQNGEEVELQGHLNATVEAICARCLKPVGLPLRAEL